jgi:hypothetical protein
LNFGCSTLNTCRSANETKPRYGVCGVPTDRQEDAVEIGLFLLCGEEIGVDGVGIVSLSRIKPRFLGVRLSGMVLVERIGVDWII